MKLFRKLIVLTILVTFIASLTACKKDDDCGESKPKEPVCQDF